MIPFSSKQILVTISVFFTILMAACNPVFPPVSTPTLTPAPTATHTPIPPVVSVNGEGVYAAEFEAEVERFQEAQDSLGITVSLENAKQSVLNDMIDSLLLEQGAVLSGFVPDEAALQTRIDTLASQVGGTDELTAWESAHGYTDLEFRSALNRQVAAAWMRDQIVASVPNTAEQVHVKQILFYAEGDAQQALVYLQTGWKFEDLASQYNPVTKGELGWFPRKFLPSPAIEEAAFALQPGQFSSVIQDETGYHILYVIERETSRLLSPEALLSLQEQALQSWLTQQRNESTILFVP